MRTDKWNRHKLVQQLKQHRPLTIGGVNYGRVVSFYMYNGSLPAFAKKAIFALLYAPKLDVRGSGRGVSFYSFGSKRRSDYDFMFDTVVAAAGQEERRIRVDEKFSLSQLARTVTHVPDAAKAVRGSGLHFIDKVAITLLVSKFQSLRVRILETMLDNTERLFVFCDAAPHDNLIAQIAKSKGIRTVTLQHGQYRRLDESNISPDAEAYENFVSDRMLTWGAATEQELLRCGISPDRMWRVGWIREWPSPVERPTTRTFGVMLNGENGADSNEALISAARQVADALDFRFYLRSHPSYQPDGYEKIAGVRCTGMGPRKTLEYLKDVEFSISHSSSAAIECLQLGAPVYILDDGRLADVFRKEGLSFSSIPELLDVIRGKRMVHPEATALWFNDDSDQIERIAFALNGDKNAHTI